MKITSCFSRGFTTTRRLVMHRHAFTRVELLAVILALAGLGLLALPALGGSASRSRLAQCFNNLRQVGAGFQSWAMNSGEKFPWQVRRSDGGQNNTGGSNPSAVNPFIHFATISNELGTPRILVCPSDYAKRPASDFSASSAGGLLHINFRNNSVGYLVGLDATLDRPGTILSGDRNVRTSRAMLCGNTGISANSLDGKDPGLGFTNGVHGLYGHVGSSDGSVQIGGRDLLQKLSLNSGDAFDLNAIGGPAPNNHVMVPGTPATVPE